LLYQNKISFLPNDIKKLQYLEQLDISNNPINDLYNNVIVPIKNMKSLKHLKINKASEHKEDLSKHEEDLLWTHLVYL